MRDLGSHLKPGQETSSSWHPANKNLQLVKNEKELAEEPLIMQIWPRGQCKGKELKVQVEEGLLSSVEVALGGMLDPPCAWPPSTLQQPEVGLHFQWVRDSSCTQADIVVTALPIGGFQRNMSMARVGSI